MNDCPLSVAGAAADVSSTGDGFAIRIHSKDKDTAQEIFRVARDSSSPTEPICGGGGREWWPSA